MVRVMVIVVLINNTDCIKSMQMMFQTLLPVILSVTSSSLPSLAPHCNAGARDGRNLEKNDLNLFRTSNSFFNPENVGNSKQSDRNAFVSRVQGVFGSSFASTVLFPTAIRPSTAGPRPTCQRLQLILTPE